LKASLVRNTHLNMINEITGMKSDSNHSKGVKAGSKGIGEQGKRGIGKG
jgi:hypothetical protein